MAKPRNFHGNFGLLQLVENGSDVKGEYQQGGTIEGVNKGGVYHCTWKNKGEQGLLKFEIINGVLTGSWKRGLEAGTMRGKWHGEEHQPETSWTIIHDIGTFYVFFGNLAANAATAAENGFVNEHIRKWEFEAKDERYSFLDFSADEKDAFFNDVYNALYVDETGQPTKSPFTQLDISHANLCEYYNEGIFIDRCVQTLFFTLFNLCKIDGLTHEQEHQLSWYIAQWKPACPKLESIEDLLQLLKIQGELGSILPDLPSDADSIGDNDPL